MKPPSFPNLSNVSAMLLISLIIGCSTESSTNDNKQQRTVESTEEKSSSKFPLSEPILTEGLVLSRQWIPSPLNTSLIAIVVDQAKFRPRIIGVTRESPSGQSVSGLLNHSQAEVAIGGGFVESFYPLTPTGLLIVDGKAISPKSKKGYSGIIAVQNKKLKISHRDVFESDKTTGAFQVGPTLVSRDSVRISPQEPQKRNPYTRGFVGIRKDGKVVLGLTENRVHLYHLARHLNKSVAEKGVGCVEAVNLSGGGAEAIAVRSGNNLLLFGNSTLRQASMIAFEKIIR